MVNGERPRRKTAIYAGGPLRRSSTCVVPIPDDILLKIFKLLPTKDRIQCAQVSNQWRSVAFDRCLWTSVHLSWAFRENSLRELLTQRCHENTLSLKITGFYSRRYDKEQRFTKTVTPALLAHINKICPNLKNLELCGCALMALDFDDIEECHMNYSFLHLTHLILKRNDVQGGGFFKLLGKVVPSLQHLTFNEQDLEFCDMHHWFQKLSVWRVSLVNMDYTCRLDHICCVTPMGRMDCVDEYGLLKLLVIYCKVGVLSFSMGCPYERELCYAIDVGSEFIDWLMKKNQVVKIIGLDEFAHTKNDYERYETYYANKMRDKTESKNAEAGPSAS